MIPPPPPPTTTNVVLNNGSPTSSSSSSPLRLVIVGAGMAGIKLAHEILVGGSCCGGRHGRRCSYNISVQLVEANSYVGGRICHDTFQDHTIELGANWISGLEEIEDDNNENPVWTLAKAVNLHCHRSTRDDATTVLALHADTGEDITEDYMTTVEKFNDIYQQAVELCSAATDQQIQNQGQSSSTTTTTTSTADVSVMSVLQQCGWPQPTEKLSTVERAVQYNVLDVWVANDVEMLSAAHDLRAGANDVDLGKDEVFVEDDRGFNCILNDMVHDIQRQHTASGNGSTAIHLNTVVREINYSSNNVVVTATNLTSGTVVTYPADVVVCTVSLGVLQQQHGIRFTPPLPEWKRRALQEIRMYTFAKVYAQFDESFQPNKDQFAIVCSSDDEEERIGHYPFWTKYKNAGNKNLYMCHLGGKEAERVEALSESEIQNEIQVLFQRAFSKHLGSTKKNSPTTCFRPKALAVTNWSRNPHFCGSYSYFPVHAFASIPQTDLTAPLSGTNDGRRGKKTLYFAGEAFDDLYNGWIQGALRSGERVAKSILEDMQVIDRYSR